MVGLWAFEPKSGGAPLVVERSPWPRVPVGRRPAPLASARIERVAKHSHVNGKSHARPGHAHAHPRVEHKPSTGITGFTKALRFLSTLSDFERLRIVRYNSQNFDLDRMRHLLKKLGNPQDQFSPSTSPEPKARAAPAR